MKAYILPSSQQFVRTRVSFKTVLILLQSASVLRWCGTQNFFHISCEKRLA